MGPDTNQKIDAAPLNNFEQNLTYGISESVSSRASSTWVIYSLLSADVISDVTLFDNVLDVRHYCKLYK